MVLARHPVCLMSQCMKALDVGVMVPKPPATPQACGMHEKAQEQCTVFICQHQRGRMYLLLSL